MKTLKILLETFPSGIELYGRQFIKVYNKEQVVEERKVPVLVCRGLFDIFYVIHSISVETRHSESEFETRYFNATDDLWYVSKVLFCICCGSTY